MALDGQYSVCQTAKITINSGKSTQQSVKGLQGMGLPLGANANTLSLSVVGTRIATKVVTGLEYEDLTSDYYFAKGDTSQQYLQAAQRSGTVIQDMWFWLDSEDFAAPDLINDPAGGIMVGTFSNPKANKNEVFSGSCTFAISGSHIFFSNHAVASTAVFSLTAGSTGVGATAVSSDTTNHSFVDLGFTAGDVVILYGVTGHLDKVYYLEVASVAAGTLTFVADVGDNNDVPETAAVATLRLHSATPIEVVDSF